MELRSWRMIALGFVTSPAFASVQPDTDDIALERDKQVCITSLESDDDYLERYRVQKRLSDEEASILLDRCRLFLAGANYGFDQATKISDDKWAEHVKAEHPSTDACSGDPMCSDTLAQVRKVADDAQGQADAMFQGKPK